MSLLRERRYLVLFLIVFVNFLGGTIVLPMLPLYSQRRFGASPEQISLLLAAFFAAQFLAAPVLGRLSDKYGRLPVLLYSQIGTVISFIMMAVAQDFTLLLLARILDGVTGGNVIVAQAYVSDITPKEKRTQGLGIIFMAFGLGYILGPALGGLIAAIGNDRLPFFIGAAVTIVTVMLTWLKLDESLPRAKRLERKVQGRAQMKPAEIIGNRSLLLILLIGFAAQFSIAVLQSTIALYAEVELFPGAGEQTVNLGVGLMLTCIGIGQFITQIALLRPALKRFGEHRLIVIGDMLRAVGMLSVILFQSPVLVGAVSLILIAFGSGLMMPSLQALVTTSVREEISGGMLGVYNASTSLGLIIGTAIGGILFSAGHQIPFWVAGIVLLLTALPAIYLMHRGGSDLAVVEGAPVISRA